MAEWLEAADSVPSLTAPSLSGLPGGWFLCFHRETLAVVRLWKAASSYERAVDKPTQLRIGQLRKCIAAARAGERLAERNRDSALSALFSSLHAMCALHLGDYRQAVGASLQSSFLYRELIAARREVYTPMLATSLCNLGYGQSLLGDALAATHSYEAALPLLRELSEGGQCSCLPALAGAYGNLGGIAQRRGDPASAGSNYRQAATVWRRLEAEQPHLYRVPLARTLHELGRIARVLRELPEAQASLQEAVEMWGKVDEEARADHWEAFGEALLDLAGVHSDVGDLPSARACCSEALAAYRAAVASQRCTSLAQVAEALRRLSRYEADSGNLVSAQAAAEEAVQLCAELAGTSSESDLARLALALLALAKVQTAANDRRATYSTRLRIKQLYETLAERAPERFRQNLGYSLIDLGVAQSELRDFEAAERNLRAAVGVFTTLSEADGRDRREWIATALNNLGVVQGSRNDLDGALQTFAEALKIWSVLATEQPDRYNEEVGRTLSNRAYVLCETANLEAARAELRDACAAWSQTLRSGGKDILEHYACAFNNLGRVELALGDFQSARNAYLRSLEVFCALAKHWPSLYQDRVGLALNGVSVAQHGLKDHTAAIEHCAMAVELFRARASQEPIVYEPELAMTLNNLATYQRALGQYSAARSSLEEVVALRRKLAERDATNDSGALAIALSNLANVLRDLDEWREAQRVYTEATALYEEATRTRPTTLLVERQRCWAALGGLLRQGVQELGWPDYGGARHALRKAIECAGQLRLRFVAPSHRQRVQRDCADTYDLLSKTCLDLWRVTGAAEWLCEAVEVGEAARARNLMDLVGDEIVAPHLPSTEHSLAEAWRRTRRRFLQAEQRLHEIEQRKVEVGLPYVGEAHYWSQPGRESDVMTGSCPETTSAGKGRGPAKAGKAIGMRVQHVAEEECQRLLAELAHNQAELLERIRAFHPEFDPDRPTPPASLAEASVVFPADRPTAVVQFTLTRDTAFALVITKENILPVALPDLNENRGAALEERWFEAYYSDVRRQSEAAGRQAAEARRAGEWSQAEVMEARSQQFRREWREQWMRVVPQLLADVSVTAIEPLCEAVAGLGVGRLVLCPHRALHILPLHACRLKDGGCLADQFEVLYAPSLSMLTLCAKRRARRPDAQLRRLLLVQNPAADAPLAFAELEGAGVAARFKPELQCYHGREAQKDVLLRESEFGEVWHYCGHATFCPDEPLRSALVLGGVSDMFAGQWMTLSDIFARLYLPQNALTVLNACETGMVRPERADDCSSLPTGFLYAGATCVISTLWSVEDLSSALLMDRFYRLLKGGPGANPLAPAAALRGATRWLRDEIHSGAEVSEELLPPLLALVEDERVRKRCADAGKELAGRFPDTPPFASPVDWGPYVCTGMGYPVCPGVP
ncbi:MAG TPA: CHAT domain-containing protein [Verrucomicrobiota bacterium]|nr:CHAT domain-containing protein [Verrucomicrobiota bacterium]